MWEAIETILSEHPEASIIAATIVIETCVATIVLVVQALESLVA